MPRSVIAAEMRHTEQICSPTPRPPFPHPPGCRSAVTSSETPRMTQWQRANMLFIVCKQLSIHQRQRHSGALVSAHTVPTPSCDVIQQDLTGQMCVINGMRARRGARDEVLALSSPPVATQKE